MTNPLEDRIKALGLTQAKIAAMIGVRYTTVHRQVDGTSSPKYLEKIVDLMEQNRDLERRLGEADAMIKRLSEDLPTQ